MHQLLNVIGVCCVVVAIRVSAGAQVPPSPAWGYGFPPADAPPAPRGSNPAAAPSTTDPTPRQIPGTTKTLTMTQIRD